MLNSELPSNSVSSCFFYCTNCDHKRSKVNVYKKSTGLVHCRRKLTVALLQILLPSNCGKLFKDIYLNDRSCGDYGQKRFGNLVQ